MGLAADDVGTGITARPRAGTRRRPFRHALVALVLAGFVISFAVGIQTLRGAGGLVNRLLGEDMVWPATQVYSELIRLESALTQLALAPDPAMGTVVTERLDVVWSRLATLEAGDVAQFLEETELTGPVDNLRAMLLRIDERDPPLTFGNAESPDAARAALAEIDEMLPVLRSWGLDVLHADREQLLGHVDDRTRAIWTVIVSFAGLVTSGLIFVLLLSLEIRAGRRETQAAERAQSEAAAAEQRLVDAIETIPEGFALYDAQDRLVLCNQRYREIYKASAVVINPGTTFEEIIRYGVDRGQYAAAIGREEAWIADRVYQHLNPTDPIEQRLNDKRWLRIQERRTSEGGVVGVRVDVTEIKRAQDLLSRAEQAANLGHFSLDVATGEMVFSAHLYAVLGLSPQDGASLVRFLDRVHPSDRQDLRDAIATARKSGVPYQSTCCGAPTDGRCRWFSVRLVPDMDARGRPLEILGTVQDITEQKQVEADLAAATADATAANAAKSQFLSIMSHEIRTPMNGVAGALNLIDRRRLGEEDAEMIDLARRSADRLRTVLNDILDFTRMESGRLELEVGVFDPRAFLDEAVQFWRAAAREKGLRIAGTAGVMVPERLIGDAGRLRQILDNLISNAIKFTTSGRIEVRLAAVGGSGVPEGTELQSAQTIRVSVRDTGPGIPEADRPRVFAEFTQLQGISAGGQAGSGLGLAICRRLCAMMDGAIDFISVVGEGTEFFFEVPLGVAMADAPALPGPGATDQADLPRNLRVLVAEDNPTNQIIIRNTLQTFGCIVDLVSDGQEAVDAVNRRPYDFVIMDVSMPVLNGVDATRQIRSAHGRDLPIIGYTAYAMVEDHKAFAEAGMDRVVAKPVKPQELATAIRGALADRGHALEHYVPIGERGAPHAEPAPVETPAPEAADDGPAPAVDAPPPAEEDRVREALPPQSPPLQTPPPQSPPPQPPLPPTPDRAAPTTEPPPADPTPSAEPPPADRVEDAPEISSDDGSGDGPLFDEAALESLRAALSPETFTELTRQFAVDVGANRDLLVRAHATQDGEAMDRASHTLAGVAGTLGAVALEACARDINRLCHRGDRAQVTDQMITDLDHAATAIITAFAPENAAATPLRRHGSAGS